MSTELAPFDALYRHSDDPWGTTSRWYERRKRSLLLASDGSPAALKIASRMLADHPNATVALHRLPQDWPRRSFDLIVLSEVLYFVDDAGCLALAQAARDSAATTGTVVACNWRAPIEGWGHRGDDVHRRFEEALDLPRIFDYVDDDFLLTGWSRDATTAAMRDGLRT